MTLYKMCPHYDCSIRNNAGYCRTTVCMNQKYNGWGNKEQAIENRRNVNPDEIKKAVEQYRQQHMTNADRIRQMSDEELAGWICCHITECARCEGRYYDGKECEFRNGQSTGLLRWLKAPTEEGDKG